MPLEVITSDEAPPRDSGLRHNILSPLETLSQSVSAIAPTTSPALTVPLVFALAGNGTWLAYSLACGATLLMALSIARFALGSPQVSLAPPRSPNVRGFNSWGTPSFPTP
jgi:hypothetical protein